MAANTNGQDAPVVEVKPQPDVYTVLIVIAALVLAVAVGLCLFKLMGATGEGGYGLTFKEVFGGSKSLPK
jgi:hypothetical protein